MNIEFMRYHMREPEKFDRFVLATERLIERHREAFYPEEWYADFLDGLQGERKRIQRDLEKAKRIGLPAESLEFAHKRGLKSQRARETRDKEVLMEGIIGLFTAATDLKVSRSEGAVLPMYARVIYTEIFGANWEKEEKIRNGPWIDAIDKYMKRNK